MADKKLYLLYIPGLGDASVGGQRLAVRSWRLWGVKAEVLQMNWDDNEAWAQKLQHILDRIDALIAQDKSIALVGASAGASAVITAYALRKAQLVGCAVIAGKVNHPSTIGAVYHRNNPAFIDAAHACDKALKTLTDSDRRRILSLYAAHDEVVSKEDSYITGAHNKMVSTIGHALTIGIQITFGAPRFLRFLKTKTS